VVTVLRSGPVDTIYRLAISSRYIARDGASMTRHFGWNAFAFGFGPRGCGEGHAVDAASGSNPAT